MQLNTLMPVMFKCQIALGYSKVFVQNFFCLSLTCNGTRDILYSECQVRANLDNWLVLGILYLFTLYVYSVNTEDCVV